MANVTGSYVGGDGEGRQVTAQWAGITEADTGVAQNIAGYPDRTVQVTGTFGGGTIVMEGSNNNTDFSALHDFQGNAIALSDTSLVLILENPAYIRPRATSGSGMSVTVTVKGTK